MTRKGRIKFERNKWLDKDNIIQILKSICIISIIQITMKLANLPCKIKIRKDDCYDDK